MKAFACYRLPYRHHATLMLQHEGEAEVIGRLAQLGDKEGFVIAPFAPSQACPILLIHPDETRHVPVASFTASRRNSNSIATQEKLCHDAGKTTTSDRENYQLDFDAFHDELLQGNFRKIVLARRSDIQLAEDVLMRDTAEDDGAQQDDARQLPGYSLFMKACLEYPRLMVALVYTPQSGLWLMATPEVLLEGDASGFSTMSLAGTQQAEPSRLVADWPVEGVEWSEKNREEQQYVTDYIERCVSSFTSRYSLRGPYTTMAANLYHLRTDIRFSLPHASMLGEVLSRLYPTPAVCGIPKEETQRFIMQHEHHPRRYYSGFVGPLSPQGSTHLFVSLRCANILPGGECRLYAGGGLLKESEPEKEWEETEAKMQTMKKIFGAE